MTDFTHSLAIVVGINAYGDGIPRLTMASPDRNDANTTCDD